MNITFFEIHLDGAQFGPKAIDGAKWDGETGDDTAAGERMDGETDVATGEGVSDGRRSPSRFAPLVVLLALGAGYVAFRRFRGGDGGVSPDPLDVDAEAVEIGA